MMLRPYFVRFWASVHYVKEACLAAWSKGTGPDSSRLDWSMLWLMTMLLTEGWRIPAMVLFLELGAPDVWMKSLVGACCGLDIFCKFLERGDERLGKVGVRGEEETEDVYTHLGAMAKLTPRDDISQRPIDTTHAALIRVVQH